VRHAATRSWWKASWRSRIIVPLMLCMATSALTLSAVIAPTAASAAPLIGPVSYGGRASGEGGVEAEINPNWLVTTWEIWLNCPGEPRCQHTEGQLPADNESYTVDLKFTGLEPGATYHFAIEAKNSAGSAFQNGEFTVQQIPPGSAPNGSKVTEPYAPPELPWANQSGAEGAAQTVAEQRAKEHEEQHANEAAAQRAAAIKRAEEQAQQAEADAAARRREEAEHSACVVPALKGDTLTAARHTLAKMHCRLGAVHRPAHHRGALYVSAQSAPVGEHLAYNAPVALMLGARRASRR
jgi:hypothetical protein